MVFSNFLEWGKGSPVEVRKNNSTVTKHNGSDVFLFRAGENKNVWIDGNDEASEGNFVFTDGSPGKKAESGAKYRQIIHVCWFAWLNLFFLRTFQFMQKLLWTRMSYFIFILLTVTYLIWGDDQPNNWAGSQHCIHLWRDGKWNDFGCDRTDVNGATLYYLCEAGKEHLAIHSVSIMSFLSSDQLFVG